MIASAIGFAAVFALVLLRLPIAFAMGLVGMIGLVYETSYRASISMVSRLIIDTSQDYGLSVIPLFILMGLFVNKGGISRELYQVSNAFLGHFRGGLAMATCSSPRLNRAVSAPEKKPELRSMPEAPSQGRASPKVMRDPPPEGPPAPPHRGGRATSTRPESPLREACASGLHRHAHSPHCAR
jgi:hypothetical protein